MPNHASHPPRPPTPRTNAEVLDQLGLIHEAMVHRNTALDARLSAFHRELAMVRQFLAQNAIPVVTPVPRTNVQKAAGCALAAAKYGTLIVGGVALLAQAVSIWRPELAAPLETFSKMLGGP